MKRKWRLCVLRSWLLLPFSAIVYVALLSGCSAKLSNEVTQGDLVLRSLYQSNSKVYDIKYYQRFSQLVTGVHVMHLYKNNHFFKEMYIPRNMYTIDDVKFSKDENFVIFSLAYTRDNSSVFFVWDINSDSYFEIECASKISLFDISSNNTIVFVDEKTKEVKFFSIMQKKFIGEADDTSALRIKDSLISKNKFIAKYNKRYLSYQDLEIDVKHQKVYISHQRPTDYSNAKRICEDDSSLGLKEWRIATIADYKDTRLKDDNYALWAYNDLKLIRNPGPFFWGTYGEPIATTHQGGAVFKCVKQVEYAQFETIYKTLEKLGRCNNEKTLACYDAVIEKSSFMKNYAAKAKKDFMERVAFQDAERIKSIDAYDGFLKKYPSGTYATFAIYEKNKLIELRDYNYAIKINKFKVYADFLSKHPNSSYVAAIKAKKDDVDPVVIAKRKQEAKEAAQRAVEERKRQIEYENRPIDYVTVNIERTCGWLCYFKNLNISGGPGRFSKVYDGAYAGTIHKGYDGQIAGTYSWSAKASDDSEYCSGTVYISGKKRNVTIDVHKGCSSVYIHEF